MSAITPLFVNAWSTTLASSVASGAATTFALTSATGLPTPGTNQFIPAVVVDTSTSPETIKEYVYITGLSGTTATVTRAAEDAATYPAAALASGLTLAAVATKGGLSGLSRAGGFAAHDLGFFSWNFDNIVAASGANFLLSGGTGAGGLNMCRVPVPATFLCSKIGVLLSQIGSGLTSGQCLAGIYDSAGNLLATTTDQSTAWAGSTGLVTMTLASPVTIVGGPDAYVHVALMYNGSSAPAFRTSASNVANNYGTSGLTLRGSLLLGSSTTALPGTMTPGGSLNNVIWAAIG